MSDKSPWFEPEELPCMGQGGEREEGREVREREEGREGRGREGGEREEGREGRGGRKKKGEGMRGLGVDRRNDSGNG